MPFRWTRVVYYVLPAMALAWAMALVPALLPSVALAAEYYVSPEGSDQDPGSVSSPWRTLAKANQALQPGDTVYLREGEYAGQLIRPSRSGAEGRYITYAAYPGETPVLTNIAVAIHLIGRSYIRIDGLTVDGKNEWPDANVQTWANLDDAQHIIIENATFRHGRGWSCISMNGSSRYNILRNNTMDYCGAWEVNGQDSGDMIVMDDGEYILIEGNHFSRGGHNVIRHSGRFNVIRNNTFDNQWGPNTGNRSVSLVRAKNAKGGWTVFEGNLIVNTLMPSDSPSVVAFKTSGTNYIVRRNFILHSKFIGTKTEAYSNDPSVTYNKIYHNVFYDLGSYAWWLNAYNGGVLNENNVFKNNMVFKSRQGAVSGREDVDVHFSLAPLGQGGGIRSNYVIANSFFKSLPNDARIHVQGIGTNTLGWFETNYPAYFRDNLQVHPDIVSSDPQGPQDFTLNSTSPLIDAGDFLTRTTSGGSGTVIPVEDAGYFTDGFGIVEPDWIQVGANEPVEIVSIDYRTHTITVAKPITWNVADGVSLPYEGVAPDIGVWESPYATQGIRITAPVAGIPVELWTQTPVRVRIEPEPYETQVLLNGEEIYRGAGVPEDLSFVAEDPGRVGVPQRLTVRAFDAGGGVREQELKFMLVRPPTPGFQLASAVRERLEQACGTLEVSFDPLSLPPDEVLRAVRVMWGPFASDDPSERIELYSGAGVPVRVPVDTRLFEDGYYAITVWNRTNHGEATNEFKVYVDNVETLTDKLFPPAFGGFVDLLRTVDRSKGWAFVAEDASAYGGDTSRLALSKDASEYLTWSIQGLTGFSVTVYAADAQVQEALEIAVSADGESWRTVPYSVHVVGEPAGHTTLSVVADVRGGSNAGSTQEARANFVRLTLKPVFPPDDLQLGEATMTGVKC